MADDEKGPYLVISNDDSLHQGDVLWNLPVPHLVGLTHPAPEALTADLRYRHVVILSQSCDLEQEKIDEVMCAQVRPYVETAKEAGGRFMEPGFRKALVAGTQPAFHLLASHSASPVFEYAFVDFHRLYVLNRSYLKMYAQAQEKRLRLLPPYREHLSQAFARYMMRVGLPQPYSEFLDLDPRKV